HQIQKSHPYTHQPPNSKPIPSRNNHQNVKHIRAILSRAIPSQEVSNRDFRDFSAHVLPCHKSMSSSGPHPTSNRTSPCAPTFSVNSPHTTVRPEAEFDY
ncbi:hypothetical protein CDAR_438071, partial [Caerostris darwini]